MDKLFDWLASLPKWLLIVICAPVFCLLGFLIIRSSFGGGKAQAKEPEEANIMLEVPEGNGERLAQSKVEGYRYEDDNTRNASSYWDQLGVTETESESGLIVSGGGSSSAASGTKASGYNGEFLDPAEYSELERYWITSGATTKEAIDAEHARKKATAEIPARTSNPSGSNALTQEQKDSIYFARIEKAYGMAAKYSQPKDEPVAAAEAKKSEEDPEENLRHIDVQSTSAPVEASFIPVDSFDGDGIITSLGEPFSDGIVHYREGVVKAKPIKATFLKNETLLAGQRVILRLMQDLTLSSGVVIPANTHITGVCELGHRLNIVVNSIHYGGKIYYTDLRVYDNDGTEGIYCPVIATSKKKRVAGETASQAASAVAAGAATVFTRNPYVGRVASSAISSSTSALRTVNSDGSSSVTVASGYEFYILEEVGDEKTK